VLNSVHDDACDSIRIIRFAKALSFTRFAAPSLRKRSRSVRLFICKRIHSGVLSLPTFCGFSQGNLIHRKRSPFPMLYEWEGFWMRAKRLLPL